MTPLQNPMNLKEPYRTLFHSLGIPLLLCCLGIGCVLFILERKNHGVERIPKDLRHIPSKWIAYRQASMFACSIAGEPTCFALLGDSTFVVGSAEPHALSLFDGQGTLLKKIDLPEEPKAIACGTAETVLMDKIVVAHPYQIAVYDAEGKREFVLIKEKPSLDEPITSFSTIIDMVDTPGFRVPRSGFVVNDDSFRKNMDIQSLVLTSDSLFAADTGKRCIYRFATNALLINIFGHGLGISLSWLEDEHVFSGFVVYASPITMTFSHTDGLLYITNPGKHRLEVFAQDGTYKPDLCFGEPSGNLSGFVGCCNPIDIAALNDGRILTVEKAIPRIKIYGTDGKLDCVVAGPDTLEDVPAILGRTPAKPGGRCYAAVPLPDGSIAVFNYEYAVVRLFAPL